MTKANERKQALIIALGLTTEEAEDINQDTEDQFSIGSQEYVVFTEEEANDKAREEIENSLWAFNADFILRHNSNCSSMDNWEYDAAITSIKEAQSRQAENLNGLVRCLITDMDEFVQDAIMEDGRGHFIAFYDHEEMEAKVGKTWYYIYRTN